jgi:hypothetical protein
MKNVLVKKDELLEITRLQDLIFYVKFYMLFGYDCEDLSLKKTCKLAVFFRIFYIDIFFYILVFFSFFYFFFLLFIFFFFYFTFTFFIKMVQRNATGP